MIARENLYLGFMQNIRETFPCREVRGSFLDRPSLSDSNFRTLDAVFSLAVARAQNGKGTTSENQGTDGWTAPGSAPQK